MHFKRSRGGRTISAVGTSCRDFKVPSSIPGSRGAIIGVLLNLAVVIALVFYP